MQNPIRKQIACDCNHAAGGRSVKVMCSIGSRQPKDELRQTLDIKNCDLRILGRGGDTYRYMSHVELLPV